jgi:TPP-dependent pyruvate/acetoin dehydrogenase alpha subunit
MTQNYTAKTQDKTNQYGWKNHELDPMEQMRRTLLAKEDQIQQLKKTVADEVKEKYSLYKRVKELNEELYKLKKSKNNL